MESQLSQNLQSKLSQREKPVYVVFPECHSVPVKEAVLSLQEYKALKTIPLSAPILKSGAFDALIDEFLPDYFETTRQYYEKQWKKGRLTQKDVENYTTAKAREELYEPLHFALMMVRKNYAEAEVGGVEATTADHTRKGLYLVNKDPRQENIVCATTLEFHHPVRFEDAQGGLLREQRFLTLVDPALGKPAMEYGFLTSQSLLSSLLSAGQISAENYARQREKLEEEKKHYIRLKVDQALAGLRTHKTLTNETPIGAYICHSTAGSDETSPYVQFIRKEVLTAIRAALEERKKEEKALEDAIFLGEECQVEAASDPKIGRKKAKGEKYAGFANVHLVCSVDAGNQYYKTFLAFHQIHSIIAWSGFRKPIFDLSRSSPTRDIVLSALVAATQAQDALEFEKKREWQQKAWEVFRKSLSEK